VAPPYVLLAKHTVAPPYVLLAKHNDP